MSERNLLDYKRIFVVDDEVGVLKTLEELLPMCDVVKASSFDEGKKFLESQYFDIAILDIMGVEGYKLLEIANETGLIALMLTAHALSLDDTVKSFKNGAASYVPKEEMTHIVTFLNDVLEAKEKDKPVGGAGLIGSPPTTTGNLALIGGIRTRNFGTGFALRGRGERNYKIYF